MIIRLVFCCSPKADEVSAMTCRGQHCSTFPTRQEHERGQYLVAVELVSSSLLILHQQHDEGISAPQHAERSDNFYSTEKRTEKTEVDDLNVSRLQRPELKCTSDFSKSVLHTCSWWRCRPQELSSPAACGCHGD